MFVLSHAQLAYLRQRFAASGAGVTHVVEGACGTSFTLPSAPDLRRRMDVFVNGVLLRETAHYTVSGAALTITAPGLDSDDLVVKYVTEA